jgi:uncharacterized C2H2 Zn-finger protein
MKYKMSTNENIFVCEFCKKEYTSISNLKYHQKNTKFCLELQSQQANLKCEYCDKVFSTSKYLKQHSNHCKIYRIYQENESLKIKISEYQVKLDKQEIECKTKLDKQEIECKTKLDYQEKETKLKLKNKDDIIKLKDDNINKLQKEIDEYKKLVTRPTNVYTTNTTNTTTNNNTNYQIQFNQLLEKIETLTSENICKKIDSIEIKELTDPGIKDFENRVSNRLSHIFKDFTFCTDKSRKTVVIKNNNGEVKKVQLNELIETGLNYGIQNIIQFISEIENFNDNRITNFSADEYTEYDEELQGIKDYFLEKRKKQTEVSLSHGNYPLPSLVKNTLSNCAHLTK